MKKLAVCVCFGVMFLIVPRISSAKPAIHVDGWGVVTFTTSSDYTGISIWEKVVDYDGIAEDGSSHTVRATYPNGDEKTLGFDYRENEHTAYYSFWDGDIPQEMDSAVYSGEYILYVENDAGQWSEITDDVQADPIPPPQESSFSPSYAAQQSITAAFDEVHVDGALYDDFEEGFSASKWEYQQDEVQYEQGEAIFEKTWALTESGGPRLELSNPETINEHSATVRVESVCGDDSSVRIGGTYGHDGQGDILARVKLKNDQALYVVYREYSDGDHYISEYLAPETELGPVVQGNTYTLSIDWDGSTLSFTVQGLDDDVHYTESFTPEGTISASDNCKRMIDIASWLTLQTTTPTFDWEEVPGSRFYRIRLYDWRSDQTLFQGYTKEPPYQLPPGVLQPGGLYWYRIYSYRDHQWFETDNAAASDYNQAGFWVNTTENAQDPYIELTSWQGVATWTSPRDGSCLSPWLEVYDAQDVPDDIASVKVIFPDGVTERPLYFVEQDTDYSGQYGTDYHGAMPGGEYTFVVEDREGHVYQASESLTSNPLPSMDAETLQPAQDAVIENESFDISWSALSGAVMYYLQIFDQEGNIVLRERTAHPVAEVTLPSALFEPGARYSYEVRAMDGFYEDLYQNISAPDWTMFNRSFTVAPVASGSAEPSLDLDGYGAVHWHLPEHDATGTLHRLEFWIKVQDADGVPENIQSLTVSHPDFGEEVLYLNESPSETEGQYYALQHYDSLAEVPEGDFTFRVLDHEGHEVTLEDSLTLSSVGIPGNTLPAEGSTVSTQPEFSWDQAENASWYKVRLYQGWMSSMDWSSLLEDTSYALPAEQGLSADKIYQYRVYAYHENPDDGDIDNYSTTLADPGMMTHFWTNSGQSACPGDCDGSGQVSISEVQASINQFLGTADVQSCCDADGDGSVSISEVQTVINAYLQGCD